MQRPVLIPACPHRSDYHGSRQPRVSAWMWGPAFREPHFEHLKHHSAFGANQDLCSQTIAVNTLCKQSFQVGSPQRDPGVFRAGPTPAAFWTHEQANRPLRFSNSQPASQTGSLPAYLTQAPVGLFCHPLTGQMARGCREGLAAPHHLLAVG